MGDEKQKVDLVPAERADILDSERSIVIKNSEIIRNKIKIAGLGTLLLATVSVVGNYFYCKDLQGQVKENHAIAESMLYDLGTLLATLDSKWVLNAETLVKILGADTSLIAAVHDSLAAGARIQSRHSELSGLLEEVDSTRKSFNPLDLAGAAQLGREIVIEATELLRELEKIAGTQVGLRDLATSLLQSEIELLRSELRSFRAGIDELIKNYEPLIHSGSLESLVLTLAKLAEFVYLQDSTVGKRILISTGDYRRYEEYIQALKQIHPDDLTAVQALRKPSFRVSKLRAAVSAGALNLRSGPSARHEVICVLARRGRVEILSKDGQWWRVSSRCGIGWAWGEYLEVIR